jgi:hypothetical protein
MWFFFYLICTLSITGFWYMFVVYVVDIDWVVKLSTSIIFSLGMILTISELIFKLKEYKILSCLF